MDSDSDEELLPIENYTGINSVFTYDDPLLVTGLLRAVVEGNLQQVKELVHKGRSVNINDNNGNTPLHISVIKNNLEILKFLLLQDEIVVNTRNFIGETPLFQASKLGRSECVEVLIRAEANVNLPNYEEITPLHVSITYPNIAHLLILQGANLNSRDYSADMPLHDAVTDGCLESVCMFLYYNADANAVGGNYLSPFMKAIIGEHFDIQEILYDYVSDFDLCSGDGISLLDLALIHGSPYTESIVQKVTKVHFNALYRCLQFSNINIFKLIWDRLEYGETDSVCITDIISQSETTDEHLKVMCDSPNTSLLFKLFFDGAFSVFISDCIVKGRDITLITKITFILLEQSFVLNTIDIYKIFANYGYCELIYLLLFIEIKKEWVYYMITCRLFFDIHTDIVQIQNDIKYENIPKYLRLPSEQPGMKRNMQQFLEYCIDNRLIHAYDNYYPNEDIKSFLPSVPKLVQLARDKFREYLIKKFNISTTCQYYTLVNCLDIGHVYKKILKFEIKLYNLGLR